MPRDSDARRPRPPWYADGLRFACSQSGKCCTAHGTYAHVYLDDAEARAMAALLGLTLREFARRHCMEDEQGQRELRFVGGACPFLEGHRCAVYAARPLQCRTWPFWRENLRKRTWEREVAAFCPGVGKGRLHTQAEIDAIADSLPD